MTKSTKRKGKAATPLTPGERRDIADLARVRRFERRAQLFRTTLWRLETLNRQNREALAQFARDIMHRELTADVVAEFREDEAAAVGEK